MPLVWERRLRRVAERQWGGAQREERKDGEEAASARMVSRPKERRIL